MTNLIKKVSQIVPSERQIIWQEMEFYSFIHFSINTYTDREWGTGNEDPLIFNPIEFNANQWSETCKSAGMKGLILTCKHHDGFCLWPSKYTDHSVKNSLWKSGKGDIVKEVSQACKKSGIKFGVYLSPWDRHEKSYGDSNIYNEFFKNQLTELLTNYGDIFTVWFDGACGEGLNGKRQIYDWNGYYELIRRLQPEAVISVCGPDVRWCGNEAGHCRKSEWSVVPKTLLNLENIQKDSQQVDNEEFSKKIDTCDEDLGSREILKQANEFVWYPAEVNTSIRPGWFYHNVEDNDVKSVDKLLEIYYGSVGGNANFLLNIPPDKRGLIHENDVVVLKKFGETIDLMFKENLCIGSKASASETIDDNHDIYNIFKEDKNLFWTPKDGTEKAIIKIELKESEFFDRIVLMEHIRSGQRVENFTIEYKKGDTWITIYQGTTIGYKRICCFEKTLAQNIKFTITNSRCILLLPKWVFI